LAALFALCGATAWGVGDFLGGLGARRVPVLAVLLISQAAGLVGVLFWAALLRDPLPGAGDALPAVAAGAAGLIGLGALYRGFAVGAMGIVAPISALSPLVPLVVDIARGIAPTELQWAGIGLALAGVVAVSREPSQASGTRLAAGAGLAVVAALGFGIFIVGIDAAADASVPWTIVFARAASVSLAVGAALATRTAVTAPARLLPLLLAVGAFDTGANVLVAAATTHGSAGIVAVLSALYPVTTIALAWIVLGERMDAVRRAGAAIALGGAALVAAG
jgi:drug/metabolite transporter (DMT)-like permease